MALVSLSRANLLHKLDLRFRVFERDGVLFTLPPVRKSNRVTSPPIDITFPALVEWQHSDFLNFMVSLGTFKLWLHLWFSILTGNLTSLKLFCNRSRMRLPVSPGVSNVCVISEQLKYYLTVIAITYPCI